MVHLWAATKVSLVGFLVPSPIPMNTGQGGRYEHMVLIKRNVALARKCAFARASIVTNLRGVAPILLASIHLARNEVNTCEQNECHALFLSDDASTSKCTLTRDCDVAFDVYCTKFLVPTTWDHF